jgi:hypothetical protein
MNRHAVNRARPKMSREINPSQMLQIQRLRLGSFNEMDGDVVADSLMANSHLWDSFVFGRFSGVGGMLIELRDLPEGHLNADTLLILTDKKRWDELQTVISQWQADEIGYTAADGETVGVIQYRTAEEVNAHMGGGFWVGGNDFAAVLREAATGSPLARKGPRVKKKQPEDVKVPILVRVWWD